MIVGTAGHIDHGKTALVRALTGVDADRLAEEKARGITIDLGYAYLSRPDGETMGFVDMPGHEKFIRNMLAGAAGIDALLLVVAADDGIMPQTREHLAIAELLGIDRALVALTKCDLAEPDRLAGLEGEIAALLHGGPLAGAGIVRTSVPRGQGIAEMQARLDALQSADPQRRDGPARLAIDRSFSLAGAGTVVTGTLVQGTLAVGDVLAVRPAGGEVRIRSLHVQGAKKERAHAGQRCGVALGGRIKRSALGRGDWLLDRAIATSTDRIDAELRLLPGEKRPLRHWTAVRFYHGAAEIAARIAVLQDTPVTPGATALVQIVLDQPVAAFSQDRFILRTHNGERTLGGGTVIDLAPPRRRRKRVQRLDQLAAMRIADPAASLRAQLACWPLYVDLGQFASSRALSAEQLAAILAEEAPQIVGSAEHRHALAGTTWQNLRRCVLDEVRSFHDRYPQLLGPNLRRIQRACFTGMPETLVQAVMERLVAGADLARDGGVYRLPSHKLGLDHGDARLWDRAAPLLGGEARFRPPLGIELAAVLGARDFDVRRVLRMKGKEGAVAEIGEDRFLLMSTLREIAAVIKDIHATAQDGRFGVADLRDRLNNGRKVAIEILEYFDRQGITARRGDLRVLDTDRLREFVERG